MFIPRMGKYFGITIELFFRDEIACTNPVRGSTPDVPRSAINIAPTVADLLGVTQPDSWRGGSLALNRMCQCRHGWSIPLPSRPVFVEYRE